MPKNVTITVEPVMAVLTPHALARMSRHMFGAGRDYHPEDRVFLIKYYLFSASIELGLKSAILATDCTAEMKNFLKAKIGHDLQKAIVKCEKLYDESFFDSTDLEAIKKINPFFKGKGLEYFTAEMMGAALTGFKALPDVDQLQASAQKVQDFLLANKYFIDGKTSEAPKGGLFNFV